MKPILLTLILGAATTVSAQNKKLDSLQHVLRERLAGKYQRMPNAWGPTTPYAYQQHQYRVDSSTGKPLSLLPPKAPGVYHLPLDGMPCIVPDTSNIAAIPNGWANPTVPYNPPHNMPNPMDKMAPPLDGCK
jgi:hypothetical protein